MSQPTAYAPSHAFVADSAIVPNFPGQQLDVELVAVKATTDQIRANLALIQRDDGALVNGTVTYDSLSASLQTNGIAPALPWATATAYAVGNAVVQGSSLYRCLISHTSGVFATDLAAVKWLFIVALPTQTLTGVIISVGAATSIASQTGTGTKFVVDTSPALAGVPTVPTAAVDTNATQIASTAFVLAQAASATPLVDSGTGTVGTSTRFARGDHVHPAGALTNTRLAKTAAYPVVNADKFSTIALGGTAFYTLTFNAASGYDANFAVMVLNEDTTRGKTLAINGLTSFILWPGQSCTIFNQNNVWKVNPSFQRWRAPINTTIYVDEINGNDANDGLAAGSSNAFKTLQFAVAVVLHDLWDSVAGAPQYTVQLADNASGGVPTVTGYASLHTAGPVGGMEGTASVVITGNVATPGNVVIIGSGGNACIGCFYGARVSVKSLWLKGGGFGAVDVRGGASEVRLSNVTFGAATGPIMLVQTGANITLDAPISLAGGAAYFVQLLDGGKFITQGFGIALLANVTFSQPVFYGDMLSGCDMFGTTWTLGGFTVTGTRFNMLRNSVLTTGTGTPNTIIPGTAVGTLFTGGQAD